MKTKIWIYPLVIMGVLLMLTGSMIAQNISADFKNAIEQGDVIKVKEINQG